MVGLECPALLASRALLVRLEHRGHQSQALMAQKVMRVRPASFPAQLARLAFRDLWVLLACGQKQRVKMAQRGLLVLLVLRGLPALRGQ